MRYSPWDFSGKSTVPLPSPFQCTVNINCRILVCCTCHFQSGSLFFVYFGFLCLQVSSVSNFCPDTGGEGGHCLGSLVQLCCREGGTLQTNITDMCRECSQCLGHTGFAPAHGMCAFLVYTAQAPGSLQGNCLKQALGCVHFPGLSHSGSGSWVLHKGTDLVGHALFCPSDV